MPAIGRVTPGGTITGFSDGINQDGEPISLLAPGDIALGPDGNVWFANGSFWSGGESTGIGRVSGDGAMTLFELPAAGLANNLVIGPDGNLWFTIWHGPIFQAIGRVTPTGTITEFDVSEAGELRDLVAGPDGNLWFTAKNGVGRLTPAGSLTMFSSGLQSSHFLVEIINGPDGNLWFSDRGAMGTQTYIGRITTAGTITQFAVDGFNPAGTYPSSLASGGDGNLWFASMQNVIGRITPSGELTEFSIGLGQSSVVHGLTPGPGGTNIWFIDQGERAIGRVAPVGPGATTPDPTLAVKIGGSGTGAVSSNHGGISCGSACDAFFGEGQVVTLSASSASGSAFAGWSGGGCAGTGACQVTLNADTVVTATFVPSDGGGDTGTNPPGGSPNPIESAPGGSLPSGSGNERKQAAKGLAAQRRRAEAKKRALKRCQALKGKAKRKCVRRVQNSQRGNKRTPARRVALAAGLQQTCADAGTAKPRIIEAWVRHPGDRKTQSMFLEADWRRLPDECDGDFERVPSVRFQLQSPRNHARWINVGGFVAPERTWKVKEEVEAEKEAEGKSCWEITEAGKTFVCHIPYRVTNRGGDGTAGARKSPGPWPDPIASNDRYRYQCTPGPGVTQVRALVRNVVKNLNTGKVAAQRVHKVPVKVKSYPVPPHPGHPKRAALQGPC
jgi:virginiamycin B lyase